MAPLMETGNSPENGHGDKKPDGDGSKDKASGSNGKTVAQAFYRRRQRSPPLGSQQRVVLPVDNTSTKAAQHEAPGNISSMESPPSSPSSTSSTEEFHQLRRQIIAATTSSQTPIFSKATNESEICISNGNETTALPAEIGSSSFLSAPRLDSRDENTMDDDDDDDAQQSTTSTDPNETVHDRLDRISTRAEEKYVMERLLEDIEATENERDSNSLTRAEEKNVMQQLLEDIEATENETDPNSLTRAEEKNVMQQLLEDIEATENETGSNSLPAKSATIDLGESNVGSGIRRTWRMPPTLGPHQAPPWGKRPPQRKMDKRKKKKKGKMDDEIIISRRQVQQSIPRWIPGELGSYDDDDSTLLFTRPEFVQKVILVAEKRIASKLTREHHSWKATLEDNPRSYLLEATGTDEALDILGDTAETFVKEEIETINLESLVGDGASLMVTVKCTINLDCDTAQQALGVCFSSAENKTEGIYIRSLNQKGKLAKALGDEGVYGKGCALLEVNNTKVSSLSEVEEKVMEAKWLFPRPRIPPKVELTLLLSKFSDLSGGNKVLERNIIRRDGLPFDKEQHDDYRLEKYMESVENQSMNKNEEDEDTEEETEGDEESSSSEKDTEQKEMEGDEGLPNFEAETERQEIQEADEGLPNFEVETGQEEIHEADDGSPNFEEETERQEMEGDDGSPNFEENTKASPKPTKSAKRMIEETSSDSDSSVETRFNQPSQMDEDADEDDKKPKAKRKRTASSDENTKQKGTAKGKGFAMFREFEKKMRPLIVLDYKDTRIDIKAICSTMWKKHKVLFGKNEHCSDSCRCLMWLPDMVENAIKDHIERQKKNNARFESEQELGKRTLGICKNFVPKFITKLQEEYPAETETQLVQRLVGMWEAHQRDRVYGMRCLDGCGCQGEWDQIFGKGDKAAARDFLLMRRRSSLQSRGIASSFSAAPSGPVVPRKKRAHDQNLGADRKKPKLTGLISSMVPRVDIFDLTFESSLPIGGYFRTRMNQCVVFSIFLKGQMAKEPKIVNGITVVSVKAGGKPVAVTSHSQLQKMYDAAKKKGGKLIISFENRGEKRVNSDSDNRMNNVYWNESGEWISGPYLEDCDGWAGGAKHGTKPKVAKKPTQENEISHMTAPISTLVNEVAETDEVLRGERSSSPESMNDSVHNVSVEEWTTIVNTENPGGRNRKPSKSLLIEKSSFPPEEPGAKADKGLSKLCHPNMRRSRRERTHSKSVNICTPNNEEIYFCKDDAPNVRRVLQTNNASDAKPKARSQIVDPEQSLINAFREKTCNDVLEILESQEMQLALTEGNLDLELALKREYSYIGDELKKLNESGKHPGVDNQKNDLSAKYRILSIYINCIHLIEKTLALKKWYVLTTQVRHIDLQHEGSIIDEIGGRIMLKLDDANVKENLDSLPVRKFAQHLSYVDENLTYTTHNNKGFRFQKRSFVIELKKVSQSFAPDTELGNFNITLDDIEGKCSLDGNAIEITESLSNNGAREVSNGRVTLQVSKRSASKEYMLAKKQEIIHKLRLQLEYMDRFNQDPNNPPGARLTGNISCMGGKSILHAAVLLVDDTDLVRKMLRLGANPRGNCHHGMGTPLSLAQRNLHSAMEKERNMRLKDIDTEQHIHRCNQARILVQMLQENIIDFPDASSAIAEEAINNVPAPETSVAMSSKDPATTGTRSEPPPSTATKSKSPASTTHSELPSSAAMESKDPAKTTRLEPAPSEAAESKAPATTTRSESPPCVTMTSKDPATPTRSEQLPCETTELKSPPRTLNWEPPPPSEAIESEPPATTTLLERSSHTARSTRPLPSPLPCISTRTWVEVNSHTNICTHGPNCKHFRFRVCHFWHHFPSPMPHVKQPPFPPLPGIEFLPDLANQDLRYKSELASDGKTWWTGAYLMKSEKTVIYVQRHYIGSGRVAENGIVWFTSKGEVDLNLHGTVHYFLQDSEAMRQKHGGRKHNRKSSP